MNFKIYKHTNKINGKIYIGLTSQTLHERCREGEGYHGCPRFYNAIKKYGWDNFEHEILLEGLTQQEAKQKESEYILKYRSNEEQFGYNLTNGGEFNQPNAEVKRKIGETNKQHMQNGVREKIKEALKDRDFRGENNPYYGKHHSPEIRKKMSANQWSKTQPEKFKTLIIDKIKSGKDSRFAKKIIRLYDGKIYDWIQECSKHNEISASTVTNHCMKRISVPLFLYYEDYKNMTKEQQEYYKRQASEYLKNPSKLNPLNKKIVCIENGQVYVSLKICSEKLNVEQGTIIRHCRGYNYQNKPVIVRKFMYYDDYEKLTKQEKEELKFKCLDKQNNKTKYNPRTKVFVSLWNGVIHYSIQKAEKEYHLASAQSIRNSCNNITPKEKQLFMWLDDYNKLTEQEKQQHKQRCLNILKNKPKKHKPEIIRLCDKKVYDCTAECAKDNNMDASSIRFHCNGKIKNKENQRFMYYDDYCEENK